MDDAVARTDCMWCRPIRARRVTMTLPPSQIAKYNGLTMGDGGLVHIES
jgi:hypothetical protein